MTYGEIEAAAPEEFLERQRLKIFMAQSRLLFMSNIVWSEISLRIDILEERVTLT